MAHEKSTWPAIETAKAINPEDSEVYCKLFNTGEWASLNKTGFFKVKYYNPENLILQHMAVKGDVYNETENKSENVNRFRNGEITQHLTSVDFEEVVRVGGIIKEFYEGFICDNLDFNPFKEYILDMTAKRNEYRKQGKNILQDMCKKYQTVRAVVVLDAIFMLFQNVYRTTGWKQNTMIELENISL